ncbi:MAG: hypothetical protein EXR72_16100 [Myxococcales bacterium]|nr:hypothetical protein [Myxococcales bacterium]
MSILTAISAFTHRTARRPARLQLLAYSGGLATLLVVLAEWIVARAEGPPGGLCDDDFCTHAPPLAWGVLGVADLFAVAVLALGLLVIAPAMVAAAVAAERRAGTLDQLRTTPLSPLALVCGIVVGAPARLYLLLVGPLVLHVVCGLLGVIPADTLVSSVSILATGGLASVLLGLTVALAPRQETGGALVALGVAAVLGFGGFLGAALSGEPTGSGWAFLHPGGALQAMGLQHDGLWRRLLMSPWRLHWFDETAYLARLAAAPFLSCLSSLALAIVLAAACCRKLAFPHRPLLSKLQALALFLGLAAAALLPARALEHSDALFHMMVSGTILIPVCLVLAVFATPTYEAWALGLRTGGRLPWWSDDAAPYGLMWTMAAAFVGLGWAALSWRVHGLCDREVVVIAWSTVLALSLPVYVLFIATRYPTAAARWALGVAVTGHLLGQVIAIALVHDRYRSPEMLFVQVAGVAGAIVPAWVAFRQAALRRRTLAARST